MIQQTRRSVISFFFLVVMAILVVPATATEVAVSNPGFEQLEPSGTVTGWRLVTDISSDGASFGGESEEAPEEPQDRGRLDAPAAAVPAVPAASALAATGLASFPVRRLTGSPARMPAGRSVPRATRGRPALLVTPAQERAGLGRIRACRQIVAPGKCKTGMKSAIARHSLIRDLYVCDVQWSTAQRMPGIRVPKSIDFHMPSREIPNLTAGLYQR